MQSIEINNNIFVLKVQKSPFILRYFILLLSLTSIIAPLIGMFFRIKYGGGIHFSNILFLGFFSLLGLYLFRIFLWNSYGKEKIEIDQLQVKYTLDYSLFKSQRIALISKKVFSINKIGYEEDNLGTLVIGEGENTFESVVKIKIEQLEQLILDITTPE